MYNKTIIEFGFRMMSWIIKTSCLYYLPQPSGSADKTDLGFDNSWYHAQPHPIIVYYINVNERNKFLQTETLFSDIFLSLWWPGCTLTDDTTICERHQGSIRRTEIVSLRAGCRKLSI